MKHESQSFGFVDGDGAVAHYDQAKALARTLLDESTGLFLITHDEDGFHAICVSSGTVAELLDMLLLANREALRTTIMAREQFEDEAV